MENLTNQKQAAFIGIFYNNDRDRVENVINFHYGDEMRIASRRDYLVKSSDDIFKIVKISKDPEADKFEVILVNIFTGQLEIVNNLDHLARHYSYIDHDVVDQRVGRLYFFAARNDSIIDENGGVACHSKTIHAATWQAMNSYANTYLQANLNVNDVNEWRITNINECDIKFEIETEF